MNDEIDLLIRQIRGSDTEPFAELIRWYERLTWSNDFSIDAAFTAEVTNAYAKVEFHDGDKIVGAATQPPWQINGINLDRGRMRCLPSVVLRKGRGERAAPRLRSSSIRFHKIL